MLSTCIYKLVLLILWIKDTFENEKNHGLSGNNSELDDKFKLFKDNFISLSYFDSIVCCFSH